MKERTKLFLFKIREYFKYILIEPWVTNFTFPNIKSLSMVFIFISLFSRNFILIWISFFTALIIHMANEFKTGRFIYLNRQRKFKEKYDALKKVRQIRKLKKRELEGNQKDL
jgi:hypothetical protein